MAAPTDCFFGPPELLEDMLLRMPLSQIWLIYDCRDASREVRDVIDNSYKLRHRLFLESAGDQIDRWVLNSQLRAISWIGIGPSPAPAAHLLEVTPYEFNPLFFSERYGCPFFMNARNNVSGLGCLSIERRVFSLPVNHRALQMLVVRPKVERASVYINGTGHSIANPSGIKVKDVQEVLKRHAPAGTGTWELRIDQAVYAPMSIMKQVRSSIVFQPAVSAGEVLDGSTMRIFASQADGDPRFRTSYKADDTMSREIAVRNKVMSYLEPANILRLAQASTRTAHTLNNYSSVAEQAAFVTEGHVQYWLIDTQNTTNPIRRKVGDLNTADPGVVRMIDAWLDEQDPQRRRWAFKPAAVFNEAVFNKPGANITQQVQSDKIDLRFSISKALIHDTSSLHDMLIARHSVKAATLVGLRHGSILNIGDDDIFGEEIGKTVHSARDFTVGETLEKEPDLDVVRVRGVVLVTQEAWDDAQDVESLTSMSALYMTCGWILP